VPALLKVEGMKIASGKVFEMAADPRVEILDRAGEIEVKEKPLSAEGNWTFPPASVSAVELKIEQGGV